MTKGSGKCLCDHERRLSAGNAEISRLKAASKGKVFQRAADHSSLILCQPASMRCAINGWGDCCLRESCKRQKAGGAIKTMADWSQRARIVTANFKIIWYGCCRHFPIMDCLHPPPLLPHVILNSYHGKQILYPFWRLWPVLSQRREWCDTVDINLNLLCNLILVCIHLFMVCLYLHVVFVVMHIVLFKYKLFWLNALNWIIALVSFGFKVLFKIQFCLQL